MERRTRRNISLTHPIHLFPAPSGANIPTRDVALGTLLAHVVPMERAAEAVFNLKNELGTERNILRAPYARLRSVAGVCDRMAEVIKCSYALQTAVLRDWVTSSKISSKNPLIRAYCSDRFAEFGKRSTQAFFHYDQEFRHEGPLCYNSYDEIVLNHREMIKTAIEMNANSILVVVGYGGGAKSLTPFEISQIETLIHAGEILGVSNIEILEIDANSQA